MKVFTFFYNRYDSATTSIALSENNIDHIVLVHNESDSKKFAKGSTIKGEEIITCNPRGLAYQRNSALEMMEDGEWAVFMCDDFEKIRSYSKKFIFSKTNNIDINFQNQNNYRLKKEHEITLSEMFGFFPKLIQIAEDNGIHLVGFGLHDNPQNLKKKFTLKGLADGRFWLIKKSNYRFDTNAQMIDDVCWTAENLIRHGKVLVLNWCVPYFQRYSAGGFGSTKERREQRIKECSYLINRFSPLIRGATKSGWPNGTHIRLQASEGNIRKARRKVGML